jgi:hypothetical protein
LTDVLGEAQALADFLKGLGLFVIEAEAHPQHGGFALSEARVGEARVSGTVPRKRFQTPELAQ